MKSIVNITFLFLLINYSLEDTIACPYQGGQINYAQYWFEPFPCSADYFNKCDSGGTGGGIPNNGLGFQYPMHGEAYAGIYLYSSSGSNIREFIEAPLIDSLISGKKYCISFYVSLPENIKYAVDKIGCFFTVDTFFVTACNEQISIVPQVENTLGLLEDTINWTLISGEFTANGSERFITIGNFRNDNNTQVSLINTNSNAIPISYYYIDAISVTLCDTTAMEALQVSDYKFQVIPNPASAEVIISLNAVETEDFMLAVLDITGRKLQKYYLEKNNLIIPTGEFDNGIYFLFLHKNNGDFIATEKLIIAR